MIKYGIIPLLKNVEEAHENRNKADMQCEKWVMKNGLIWLKKGIKE